MTIQVRCQQCKKSIAAPDEYAGKKVKCRCGAVFVVPAPPPLSSDDPLSDLLSGELPSEQPMASPLGCPTAAPPLAASSTGRQRAGAVSGVRRRLWERPLATIVAAVSLALLVFVVAGSFARDVQYVYAILSVSGAVLAGVGLCLPVTKRRGPYGPWLVPQAAQIARITGTIGGVIVALVVLLMVCNRFGFRPLGWLGLSYENAMSAAMVLAYGSVYGTGVSFAVCLLAILASVAWRLSRQHGLMGAVSIYYLGLTLLAVLFLESWSLLTTYREPKQSYVLPTYERSIPSPSWPSGRPRRHEPGYGMPPDPDWNDPPR